MKKYNFKKESGKQYDESIRKHAKQKVGILYLVVAYILYMIYGIIKNKLMNQNAMSWMEIILASVILGGGAIAVAVIATLRMGRELAESEIVEHDEEAEA